MTALEIMKKMAAAESKAMRTSCGIRCGATSFHQTGRQTCGQIQVRRSKVSALRQKGLTQPQIAQRLGTTVGVVKADLSRIRERS